MRSLTSAPLALGAACLVLAACGGSTPTMDAAVAEELAGRADLLAARLDAGDACAALETAGQLVAAASGGRDAGEVPEVVADEVIGTARDTVRGLTCEPEPEPEPEPALDEGDDRGEQPGKGKGDKDKGERGEGRGDDDDEDGDGDDD